FEGEGYILTAQKPLEDKLRTIRTKAFEARAKRVRPFLDTKILTAWNGQMIAAYASAGRLLKESRYIESAARAAGFLLKNLRTTDGRLLRTYGAAPGEPAKARVPAYLDDYAFLVHGLLCLHDATGTARWLDEARSLTDAMIRLFGDGDQGGFFYTGTDA